VEQGEGLLMLADVQQIEEKGERAEREEHEEGGPPFLTASFVELCTVVLMVFF